MPNELQFDFGSLEIHTPSMPSVDRNGKNEVIDGDTIKVGGQLWRIMGWDAPPLTGNCCGDERRHGEQAREYLQILIQWGAANGTLKIELRNKKDKYGRPLIVIWVGDEEAGKLMSDHGLAHEYHGRGPKPVFCNCEHARRRFEEGMTKHEAAKQRAFEQKRLRRNVGPAPEPDRA